MSIAPPFDTKTVSSDYTTDGEAVVYVRTDQSAVTITLASADAQQGSTIRVVDVDGNASGNNITIQTEGSESIFPDNVSSITITLDHTYQRLWCDGQNWFAERNVTSESEYKVVKDGTDGPGIINIKTQ
jgi:hypothetical protein